jgi:hypothetical protein
MNKGNLAEYASKDIALWDSGVWDVAVWDYDNITIHKGNLVENKMIGELEEK